MAAADFFLKLEGIDGESLDDKHKNEIEVSSCSIGGTNAGSGGAIGGSGVGKVNVQDISFTKLVDKASPNLFKYLCSGKPVPTATITFRKAGEKAQEYLVVTLTQVFISSYHITAHGGTSTPNETFSLNFAKIKYEYAPQKADGTLGGKISMTYDVPANKVS